MHNTFRITVLAPHAPSAKFSETISRILVIRFPYFFPLSQEKLTTGVGILHMIKGNSIAKVQMIFFVTSEILYAFILFTRYRFDIIHAHWLLPQGVIAVFIKIIFHVPVIVTVHGTDIFALKKFNFLKRFVLQHVDICTVNSSATHKEVCDLYPHTKTQIIPMGVDLKVFSSKKRKKNSRLHVPIILGVGRLIPWKGMSYLISAMPEILKAYPNAMLYIVGTGPSEALLRSQAKKHGLLFDKNIFFLGNISHDKLAEVYRKSNVFVSPSITVNNTGEKEAQGLVVLEAMASGCPVIATRSGGIVDLVEDKKNGLLVREKDAQAIAKNVVFLLSHKKERKEMIKNGLVKIQKSYSWESTAKSFEQLYEQLILK